MSAIWTHQNQLVVFIDHSPFWKEAFVGKCMCLEPVDVSDDELLQYCVQKA